MADTYKPTAAMAAAAKRGLEMRDKQPKSNKGGTAVGLARANQLVKREPLSLDTVKRMYSFFSRHEVDKQSDSWKKGNSKGEQAWLLWGGDAGFSWSRKIVKSLEANMLKEVDGRYCAYSEDGTKSFGCYDTKAEAEQRLRQVEYFKRDGNMSKQLLHFNQTITGDMVRREIIDGAESIVIRSATLPDNIVMNGGLYPAEEIEKSFASLERVLAPVGHPKKNGKFISATDPYAVHNFDVGAYVANVERKNGKVYHDTIINIEVAKQTERGRKLLDAIAAMEQTGEPIHTSTGVLLEREPLDAPLVNTKGQEYSWVARNMSFDHNAILLNEPGAATPSQGVGLMVNAEMVDMETFAIDEPSLEERREMLAEALKDHIIMAEQCDECDIEGIYPDSGYFVYETKIGAMEEYRKRSYDIDEDGNVTIGEQFEVVREKKVWKLVKFIENMPFASSIQAAYNEAVNNQTSDEGLDMTKEEMQALLDAQAEKMQANFKQELATLTAKVETLEANAQAAEKAEREQLEANAKAKGFSDDVIAGMQTNALKAVLGVAAKPAAERVTTGELQGNGQETEFSRELP